MFGVDGLPQRQAAGGGDACSLLKASNLRKGASLPQLERRLQSISMTVSEHRVGLLGVDQRPSTIKPLTFRLDGRGLATCGHSASHSIAVIGRCSSATSDQLKFGLGAEGRPQPQVSGACHGNG